MNFNLVVREIDLKNNASLKSRVFTLAIYVACNILSVSLYSGFPLTTRVVLEAEEPIKQRYIIQLFQY